MLKKDPLNLIWVDLEMTGLDPKVDTILEIATIVSSPDLSKMVEGPNLVIHQPDEVLEGMNDFVTEMHSRSGLTERVRTSTISMQEAEQQTLAFLKEYIDAEASPMCGNTISQDRRFLLAYMPTLEAFFSYRHIDVSTLKELAKRWQPQAYEQQPKKQTAHRALDDIHESIDELQYYRDVLMK